MRPPRLDAAARRLDDLRDEAQQRRLARAVPPDEPDGLAGLDDDRDVAQRLHLARAEAPAGDEDVLDRALRFRVDAEGPRDPVDDDASWRHATDGTPWTSRASREICSGSVRGRTPCPRLKMWPGPARRHGRGSSRGCGLDALPRPEQDGRVEVALHAAVVPDRLPALVERDPPVEADHVAARRRHRRQQRRGARAEVDRRRVDRGEDLRRPRRDELLVVGGRERADPRVEQLHDVGARRAPAPRGTSRSSRRASPSARSRPSGSEYIIVFTVANSRDGLPSTR